MQHKLRNCLFAIIVFFVVICWGALMQAEESTAINKNSTTPISTAINKTGTTDPGKVASVNGTIISKEQFDRALSYQQEIAEMRGVTITDEQMPELKFQVLESLISTELLYQESLQSGIKVEEKEINDTYEANKQKARFETDAEFEEALKQSNRSLTSYKAEIKQGLAVDNFIKNKFTNNTVVTDSEAKKYYDDNPSYFRQSAQVRVSHIMINVDLNADQSQKAEARKKIEKVMERLKAGEDFTALAKEVSEDTYTKESGGDLGYFSKGQILQSLEDEAFALKEGEISDIVESASGYHIIKITDKTDSRTISYEEAKDDIINSLKNSKVNSAVSKYITVLRNKSTIETFPISK